MILNFKLTKPANLVFDYLTDMDKFVAVHPCIHKIEPRENGYHFYETLKLGFIPFSFSYPATVESSDETNSVVMRATVWWFTDIELLFTIKEEKDSCAVEEKIKFKTPFPIVWLLCRIFRQQHYVLFQNIDNVKF